MSDLGQLLKKARLEKRISLEDLQETTKIRKRYLEAIEDGNYKVLPGNFYVRAFIKSYAEAVGLEPNDVLNLYQNVIPATEPEVIEPVRSKRRTSRSSERIGRWASSAMVIGFIVLIMGVVYYFVNTNYNGTTSDASKNLPERITEKEQAEAPPSQAPANGSAVLSEKAAEPVPAVPVTPPPPASEVKFVKALKGTDYYTVSGADKIKIEMKIIGDACWMSIDEVGSTQRDIEQGEFKNGETKSWELPEAAYLVFGKANAVQLTINGTPVVVGDVANVKKIRVDLLKG